MMKMIASFTLAALIAGSANAACIAEYKAKRDNPLKLIYGTAKVQGACTVAAATAQLNAQLSAKGITLLKVLSVTQE